MILGLDQRYHCKPCAAGLKQIPCQDCGQRQEFGTCEPCDAKFRASQRTA